jgi:hypothetical protein
VRARRFACGSERVERRPGERGEVADAVGVLFGEVRAAGLVGELKQTVVPWRPVALVVTARLEANRRP